MASRAGSDPSTRSVPSPGPLRAKRLEEVSPVTDGVALRHLTEMREACERSQPTAHASDEVAAALAELGRARERRRRVGP